MATVGYSGKGSWEVSFLEPGEENDLPYYRTLVLICQAGFLAGL
jgi:hypothetical protein